MKIRSKRKFTYKRIKYIPGEIYEIAEKDYPRIASDVEPYLEPIKKIEHIDRSKWTKAQIIDDLAKVGIIADNKLTKIKLLDLYKTE